MNALDMLIRENALLTQLITINHEKNKARMDLLEERLKQMEAMIAKIPDVPVNTNEYKEVETSLASGDIAWNSPTALAVGEQCNASLCKDGRAARACMLATMSPTATLVETQTVGNEEKPTEVVKIPMNTNEHKEGEIVNVGNEEKPTEVVEVVEKSGCWC